MKHGSITTLQSQISSQLSGQQKVKTVQKDQKRKCQLVRLWPPYFGMRKVFYSSITLRMEEEPSIANIIRYTTLLSPFSPKFEVLFWKSLAIVGYHLEKTIRRLRRSTNRSVFHFFIRTEMLMSQAMCHRSKQMVVGRSSVWRVRWVG